MTDSHKVHMEIIQSFPASERDVWSYDGKTIEECQMAFIKAPIFVGKSFWDAEKDVEWVDD